VEDRKLVRPENKLHGQEVETELFYDNDAQAFAEGQEAAKEAFAKVGEMLSREKDRRSK
jgi:hypothetical protein